MFSVLSGTSTPENSMFLTILPARAAAVFTVTRGAAFGAHAARPMDNAAAAMSVQGRIPLIFTLVSSLSST